jgi:hypothetical protein
MVSHIYREGNECADKLANIGLSLDTFQLWDHLPLSLGHSFGIEINLVCQVLDFLIFRFSFIFVYYFHLIYFRVVVVSCYSTFWKGKKKLYDFCLTNGHNIDDF